MKQPNPEEIIRLLAEFQPKRKLVFEHLYPWQLLIEGLRQKGAAFEAIAAILRQQGLDTNREQIRRFCRHQLDELGKGVPKVRRKARQPEAGQNESTETITHSNEPPPPPDQPPKAPENLQATLEENRKQFLPGLPRRTGPRVANITPRNPNE